MCVRMQYFFCVIVDNVQWWFNVGLKGFSAGGLWRGV